MAIEIEPREGIDGITLKLQDQTILQLTEYLDRGFYSASWQTEMTPADSLKIFSLHVRRIGERDGYEGLGFIVPNSLRSNIDENGIATRVSGRISKYGFAFIAAKFGEKGEVVLPASVNYYCGLNDSEEFLKLYRDTTEKVMDDATYQEFSEIISEALDVYPPIKSS